ncbi:MAG: hypothetical protein BWX88_05070 [Planctomycetes bacterium ADurb.Bin126]|nr:MAG: hypothetical protein BWX88_05070 [Planctomycetes bacterium ADurb.Bin126]
MTVALETVSVPPDWVISDEGLLKAPLVRFTVLEPPIVTLRPVAVTPPERLSVPAPWIVRSLASDSGAEIVCVPARLMLAAAAPLSSVRVCPPVLWIVVLLGSVKVRNPAVRPADRRSTVLLPVCWPKMT